MKKITIFGACINGGDGSVGISWYLTSQEAEDAEMGQGEGWGEDCTFSVETYEGSNIHITAASNSNQE